MSQRDEPLALAPALGAAACGVFVVLAVAAEIVAGEYAASPALPVPAWEAHLFPLTWPQPVRVGWWLLVAAAAGGFRFLLHRAGLRQRGWVVVVTVVPFVIFAGGVAAGATWATFH